MTFTKISVLVPTRKRVTHLQKMIASFEQTNDGCAELVFRVDDDDEHTQMALTGQNVLVGPRFNGYSSMHEFFNGMLSFASGDVLMIGNDDMVFKTPGWPTLILNEANKYPDGVFVFAVRSFNDDHFPFAIVSRKAVDVLGFIWHPGLFWGDIFLRDVMGAFGRAVKLPNIEVEHEWMGHTPDATFLEGKQHEIWERDATYWATAHAPAVSEAIEKLRPMVTA